MDLFGFKEKKSPTYTIKKIPKGKHGPHRKFHILKDGEIVGAAQSKKDVRKWLKSYMD